MIMHSRYTDSSKPAPRVLWTSIAAPTTLSVTWLICAGEEIMPGSSMHIRPPRFSNVSTKDVRRLAGIANFTVHVRGSFCYEEQQEIRRIGGILSRFRGR